MADRRPDGKRTETIDLGRLSDTDAGRPNHCAAKQGEKLTSLHGLSLECHLQAVHHSTSLGAFRVGSMYPSHDGIPNSCLTAAISASVGKPASLPRCWILYAAAARAKRKCCSQLFVGLVR